MLELSYTVRFKKESKLQEKRGKDIRKLRDVIVLLRNEILLPARYRNHKLGGNWMGHWECHLEPDWLLVYQIDEAMLKLVATGTHTDLFK